MAQVTLPYTLTAGTPENVNNLVSNLNALVTGVNTIDTAQIADGAVTSAKLASPPTFVRAAATTTQDGVYASSVIYTPATITLTPGTWIVFAGVSVINLTTADDASVGIFNRTTGAAVANSRGAAAICATTARVAITSQQTLVTVTVSTQLCPEAYPNGGSILGLRSLAGGSAGYISAVRITVP